VKEEVISGCHFNYGYSLEKENAKRRSLLLKLEKVI